MRVAELGAIAAAFASLDLVRGAPLGAASYAVNPALLPGLSRWDSSSVPDMWAGIIPISDADNSPNEDRGYFFWKYHDAIFREQHKQPNNLIIWLNGGPGCSSVDGNLLEVGPFRLNADVELIPSNGSWTTRGDVVFVDQPFGTGFSQYADSTKNTYDSDLTEVAEHFVSFLVNYFKIFPDDLKKNLIVSGESYAGQYVPFIADAIQRFNNDTSRVSSLGSQMNLKGLLIGNGWFDPNHQSLSYVPWLQSVGVLDQDTSKYPVVMNAQHACEKQIQDPNAAFVIPVCDSILNHILDYTANRGMPEGEQCLNVYDYTARDSYPACGSNWPPELPYVSSFFQKGGVLEALHVPDDYIRSWKECTGSVSDALTNHKARPSVTLLPSLLESGLQIILFNGDHDIICNNLSVERMIANLTWNGATGFTGNSEKYDWQYSPDDTGALQNVGTVQYERDLTYVSVYNASHMVGWDHASVTRGLVDILFNDVRINITTDGKLNKRSDLITYEDFSGVLERSRHAEKGGILELLRPPVQPSLTYQRLEGKQEKATSKRLFATTVAYFTALSVVLVAAYYYIREHFRSRIHAALVRGALSA